MRKYILTTRGDWSDLKGKLKSKYSTLTDTDLEIREDKPEEMMEGIRLKLNKTRQELIWILNRL